MKTYYCPRGCNVFDTNDTQPECGACGSKMSTDDTAFNDAIEFIENDGIARVERELNTEFEKAGDEAKRRNKDAVFEALSRADLTHARVGFNGVGDQGQIEWVSAERNSTPVDFPSVNVLFLEAERGRQELKTSEIDLRVAIDHLCYGYLEEHHGGWEIDAGSFGEFVFDVAARIITFYFSERVEQVYDSTETF